MSGGQSGGSLMGGNDESSSNSLKEETSYMEGRNTRQIEVPTAFTETLSIRVCPKQRLGITIRQSDNRVMGIHWSSPLHNKMCIGDRMLKVNDADFNMKLLLKAATPHKTIGCSSESIEEGHTPVIMKLTIERAVYSWSRLEMTTLEKLLIPKLSKAGAEPKQEEIFTGRPLKRYTVVLRRPCVPGITLASIGLSLRYDSRERVTVAAVEAGSLASAHLRPWDIIKRVNNETVNTKTMCAFMIIKSLKDSGQVILSVEVMNNTTSSRDTMEMPEDVVNICANQIGVIRSGTLKCLPSIFIVRPSTTSAASPKKEATSPGQKDAKNEKEKRITHAEGKAREEEIVSDTPEGTSLRQAKSANETSIRKIITKMPNEGEIRWEIDMAVVPHQNTTYRSPEIIVGGLKWEIIANSETSLRTGNVKQLLLFIHCKNEYAKELWNCEHRCSLTVVNKKDSKKNVTEKFCKYFTNDCSSWATIFGTWDQAMNEEMGFIRSGKIEVQAKIKIISHCADRDNNGRTFSESDDLSDICLVVGGEKLHVSKTMLAVHSPVFKAMFFGNFEEASKSEVEIKEVEHQHFLDFLNIIYSSVQHITEQNVENILAVADRFQVKYILDAAESFLMYSTKLKITKKLELSETYKLDMLQVHLLRSFTKLSDIKALEFDHFFLNFSDSLKGKICYRTMELIPKNFKK